MENAASVQGVTPLPKEQIIIYGAGDYGRKALAHYADDYAVVAFVDSDSAKAHTEVNGVPVYPPDELGRMEYSRIFVASSHADEIVRMLTGTHDIAPQQIHVVPISVLHADARNDPELGRRFLDLVGLLEQHNIPCWLDHSSLLGLMRDGDPCGVDVDLCIFAEHSEATQQLLAKSYPADAVAVYRYGFDSDLWRRGDIRQIKLYGALDIHVKICSRDAVYWLVGPMLLRVDVDYYDGYECVEWKGARLKAPRCCRKYLSALYGEWTTSASGWTYSDYKNIERVFELNELQGDTS